jgi:hypothetical protein
VQERQKAEGRMKKWGRERQKQVINFMLPDEGLSFGIDLMIAHSR